MPNYPPIHNGKETVTSLVARLVSEAHDTYGPNRTDIMDMVMEVNELDNVRREFLSNLMEFTAQTLDAPNADFIEYDRFETFADSVFYRLVNESITDFFNTPVYGEDAENEND